MKRSVIWVKEGIVATGPPLEKLQDLTRVIDQGIESVINLQVEPLAWDRPGITFYHLPLDDRKFPSKEEISDFIGIIYQHFMIKEPVFVNDYADWQSATILLALWLCSLQVKNDTDEVIANLQNIHPDLRLDDEQRQFLAEMCSHVVS